MKKVFVLVWFLLLLGSVIAIPVEDVQLTGYVNDYTNTLTSSEAQEISDIAQSLQQQGVAEVAVVIVDNFNGFTREQYAIEIAHDNLGDTQDDNGVLILVGLEVREYRIEVGYGLEGILNDAKVGRMGRELLVPNFQAGNYGQGILELTQAIGYELLPEGIPPPQNYTSEGSSGIGLWFLFIILFFIFRAISYARYRKKHYKKSNDDDLDDAFTAAMFASWFFRPPRGGFGGGGGFGGFGGGGFGGGGAGGGW